MKKKLVLGSIFSLTLFTIAVSLVRGIIHSVDGKLGTDYSKSLNPT